ncbi:MAG: hypothetical protein R6V51_04910, partial [Dehalococcoidia bacterium]
LSHSTDAEEECRLYGRLLDLFEVIDGGSPARIGLRSPDLDEGREDMEGGCAGVDAPRRPTQ